MATVKYLLQSQSNASAIYLRLSVNRKKSLKRKTGFNINFKDWSKATGLPKQNSVGNKKISNQLKSLEAHILNELNISNIGGDDITGDWLANSIDHFFGRIEEKDTDGLINYGEHFIENLPFKVDEKGNKGVSQTTVKKYRTIVNKLIGFEKYKKKKILVKDVDLDFRTEFMKYLSKVDKINDNTIGRYIKFVKTICLDAQKNGVEVNHQLQHFRGYTVKAEKVTLSFKELETIKNKELTNENHQIARDWLIIGCYTGQRVSDLLRMNSLCIENIQNFEFIVLEQMKTGKLVQIPIHPEVRNILSKRKGEFPPAFSKNLESSKTMFNRYLKQLCQLAGINEMLKGSLYDEDLERNVIGTYEKHKLVSSHICRRSFATNFYGNPNYPTPLLMNITAHSTERMFLEYIGKKPIDYGLQLAKIWAKEAQKGTEKAQLKVVKDASNI